MAESAAEAPAKNGGGGDSGSGTLERGVAPIKPQYLTTKEQFHKFLEARGQEKLSQETDAGDPDGCDLAEPEAKRIRLEEGQVGDGQTEEAAEPREQPQAQKRARGQNKGRPHMKPNHYDKNKLCPSLVQESATKCFFGDRCRFLHDVGRYLETKPADLGPCCVLFETYGRCPYGVTCRFAGAHLGPEGQNLVQREVAQAPPVRNGLDKALQQQLRKRQVHFERAEQALRQLGKGHLPGPIPPATVPEGAPGQDICDTQQAPLGPGTSPPPGSPVQTCGPLTDEDIVRLRPCEKRQLDINGKLYLAPLTTCGNLPFRRICKRFGADVTCGEMAVCTNLLQGQTSEWALLKRHQCEDIFGVQLEGAFPDTMTKCAELLNRTIEVDFVDINVGCPIDLVYKKGGGCALMNRSAKFQQIVRGMNQLHGRSREQRYTKLADWQYIEQCVAVASPMPLFGNGDILSYEDANRAMQTGVAGIMIARSRSSDTGTSRLPSAWTSCATSHASAWSTGAQTPRAWRRPAASFSNGSPSCAGTCQWACWSGSHRGSMSGPRTTWAETTWRHSWPARGPLTGSASVRCCWDPCPPSLFSCRNTRPTHTSSCGLGGVWRPPAV
ncbi:tRNA-dihydrouridine(47) synthase [NAD(P)(+)]-like isoform X2 [Pteropus medius]|uniref:tRNA-dihydrouridine(47) synthase [NAD(P)(+)]-like isoform X2 n=1 Tax=Pteropus vampyrus TaxID=132908 RepID=UPI00196AF612|nr:tRNA-dihydrouridine(47) synthase [NAD(P)(+)]-like isoform X2 [Pteropus giganteus]